MSEGQAVTGVILAGGRSSRMGRDKANLTGPSGKNMLSHVRQLFLSAGAEKTVILGRPDIPGAVPDRVPFAGPVAAIADYLRSQAVGSAHVFMPIDMPEMTVHLLERLTCQPGWAFYNNFYMPFQAIAGSYDVDHINRVGDLLSFMQAKPLQLSRSDHAAFMNLNRPEDFARWLNLLRSAQSTERYEYV